MVLVSVFLVITIVVLSKYIGKYLQSDKESDDDKIPGLLFYFGLLFFTLSALDFIVLIPVSISWCDSSLGETYGFIHGVLYSNIAHIMSFIYVLRVYIVLKDSIYAPTKCTKGCYIITHALIFGGYNFGVIENRLIFSDSGTIFIGSMYSAYLLLNLVVIGYFIYKLIRIYKTVKSEDSETSTIIISTITKLTTLYSASTILTISVPIAFSIYTMSERDIDYGITKFIIVTDVFTNMIYTAMSYKYFNSMYYIICGCIDNKCRICWSKIVKADHEFIMKSIHNDIEKELSITTPDLPAIDLTAIGVVNTASTTSNETYSVEPTVINNENEMSASIQEVP